MSGRSIVWACIIVVVALMFYRLTPMVAEQDSVHRTYACLVEVDALIHRDYISRVEDRRLVDGAIHGMMLQLDRYSGYVSPDEMLPFQRRISGSYLGVGLELGIVHDKITVVAPLEMGPAHQAGIRPGDVVLAVNGRPTKDMSVMDVESLLVGEQGTAVTLTIARKGGWTREFDLVRQAVTVPAVKGVGKTTGGRWDYLIDPQQRIAYIRVSGFRRGMIQDFNEALDTLQSQVAAGLVLDLRFNPGGLLPQAIAMIDRFLDQGPILSTMTRHGAVDTYVATADDSDVPIRLAILINGSSASAAEIVAGSLQARGRAIIVGERSFGKGSVQEFIRLHGGRAGIRLTTAYHQLPNGRVIHKTERNAATSSWGVIPDITIALDEEEYEAIRRTRIAVDSATSGADDRPTILIDRQLGAAMEALTAQ